MTRSIPKAITKALRQFQTEVESRFGFLPNFYRLAPENPEITANLWGFARFAYLDNPLPSLFKERLFVYLSRFCDVRYCIVRHVGFLAGLGRPAGDDRCPVQTVEEIIRLIRRPLPRGESLEPYVTQSAACEAPLADMTGLDSAMEEAIFACATHAFLQTPDAPRCLDALKRALGESRFERLMTFLAFVRTAHYWTKVHAELDFEEDVKRLLASHEALAECLLNDPEVETCEISRELADELASLAESKKRHDLLRAHQGLRESERRFREVVDALPAAIYTTDSEAAAAQLAAIVESSNDAIISMDLKGIITSWNKGAKKLFGYAADEVIGEPVTILFPEDRLDEERRILEGLKRGERIENYDTVRRSKDGREIDISMGVSPIRDGAGKIIGASKIARDISERKRIETEKEGLLLKESASRAEAEAANRSKDEFIAIVSHELRAPLNSILGYNRMLREKGLDEARLKHCCEIIERNARTQLQLIEDLLDTARIVSGKLRLDLRRLDVASVIAAALDTVRPAAEARGVRLRNAECGMRISDSRLSNDLIKTTGPGSDQSAIRIPHSAIGESAIVLGDAARLQQIVGNLLSNAIKFTPAGGSVELRSERDGEHIRIVVSDTGKGIQPEFLSHVFDRFRQVDSSGSKRGGGLGLGLALVKHLAELHGGNVDAASAGVGRGATFTVTLPLAKHSGLRVSEPSALAMPAVVDDGETRTNGGIIIPAGLTIAGVRVLVVDDQEEARAMIADFLGRNGAVVTTASSGAEALNVLSNPWGDGHPDVLLCDIAMPGEDGYASLRRVRALEEALGVAASERIPAVALTALTGNEDRLRALSAGFYFHVAKPVDPVELTLVIANVTGTLRREEKFQ
jgi:PAS domain S-box-containing protein